MWSPPSPESNREEVVEEPCIALGMILAAMHLFPNQFDPRTSGPPLPVPLDKQSP